MSVLPEMSGTKCFNGVSWELYETPILMFDEVNTAFRVVCKNGDPRSIDLVTYAIPFFFLDSPYHTNYFVQNEEVCITFTTETSRSSYKRERSSSGATSNPGTGARSQSR